MSAALFFDHPLAWLFMVAVLGVLVCMILLTIVAFRNRVQKVRASLVVELHRRLADQKHIHRMRMITRQQEHDAQMLLEGRTQLGLLVKIEGLEYMMGKEVKRKLTYFRSLKKVRENYRFLQRAHDITTGRDR